MILAVVSLRIYDKDGPVPNPIKTAVKFLHLQYSSPKFWRNRRMNTVSEEAIGVNEKKVSGSSDIFETRKLNVEPRKT